MRGGHNSTGRIEAERLLSLDVTECARNGVFTHNHASLLRWTQPRPFVLNRSTKMRGGTSNMRIGYISPAIQKYLEYTVHLTDTSCHYGSRRYWFVCPLARDGITCGRRVGRLYLCGTYFGCRHCHRLTYYKCNRGGKWKALVTTRELEERAAQVSRMSYAGRPTKKVVRYKKTEERFVQWMYKFGFAD